MDWILIKEFNLAKYMFGLDWAISKCREAHSPSPSPSPSPLSVNGIGIGKGLISNQANQFKDGGFSYSKMKNSKSLVDLEC